jgi:hypothetical protein
VNLSQLVELVWLAQQISAIPGLDGTRTDLLTERGLTAVAALAGLAGGSSVEHVLDFAAGVEGLPATLVDRASLPGLAGVIAVLLAAPAVGGGGGAGAPTVAADAVRATARQGLVAVIQNQVAALRGLFDAAVGTRLELRDRLTALETKVTVAATAATATGLTLAAHLRAVNDLHDLREQVRDLVRDTQRTAGIASSGPTAELDPADPLLVAGSLTALTHPAGDAPVTFASSVKRRGWPVRWTQSTRWR